MTSAWRLLDETAGADGAAQMARDEALLEAAQADPAFVPTLRLYQFLPATLSLGRTQALASVNADAARAAGLGLVRRPTGGMGVLHHRELTYSFVARVADPFTGSIEQNYTLISEALAAGFTAAFGCACELEPSRPPKQDSGACFIVPGLKELKVGGKKLVGSAQRRLRDAFLQHGAIPLNADFPLHAEIFRMPEDELREAMTDLSSAANRSIDLAAAATAVRAGFEQRFGMTLEAIPLSASLAARARTLAAEKYATAAWTERAV